MYDKIALRNFSISYYAHIALFNILVLALTCSLCVCVTACNCICVQRPSQLNVCCCKSIYQCPYLLKLTAKRKALKSFLEVGSYCKNCFTFLIFIFPTYKQISNLFSLGKVCNTTRDPKGGLKQFHVLTIVVSTILGSGPCSFFFFFCRNRAVTPLSGPFLSPSGVSCLLHTLLVPRKEWFFCLPRCLHIASIAPFSLSFQVC